MRTLWSILQVVAGLFHGLAIILGRWLQRRLTRG